MAREYTNKLGELMDEGLLDSTQVVEEMMKFFSEDDIQDFCENSFGGEISGYFEDLN